MPRSSSSDQGFCWRAWPCSECNKGVTPIGHILGRIEASPESAGRLPEEIAKAQSFQLIEWVESCSHTGWLDFHVPQLAQGSEHAVYLQAEFARVFKLTLPDTFGDFYYLRNGKVNQEKCTPLEYLVRLHLWDKLFSASPTPIGITRLGQIVSKQDFISGSTPEQDETNEFLHASGLEGVRIPFWLWRRKYAEFEVWVGDARCDNFVKTDLAIVPIDIRIWFAAVEPS